TRPEKATGTEEMWDQAEEALRSALGDREYGLKEGDGAFYGPKIDIHLTDSLGRSWQCGTVQLDFNLPERFGMEYVDSDGQHKRPYMVHRALLGSIERFFGVFIEHTAGAFPVWLMPDQVMVIPVAAAFDDYAKKVVAELRKAGIRISADLSDARMNAKIRTAQGQKIPYMLVVGQKEADEGRVAVRFRDGRDQITLELDEFKVRVLARIAEKSLDL
ncbi:MAG: threonine--tRNA ligase, partial [Spirochaetota bacterium]